VPVREPRDAELGAQRLLDVGHLGVAPPVGATPVRHVRRVLVRQPQHPVRHVLDLDPVAPLAAHEPVLDAPEPAHQVHVERPHAVGAELADAQVEGDQGVLAAAEPDHDPGRGEVLVDLAEQLGRLGQRRQPPPLVPAFFPALPRRPRLSRFATFEAALRRMPFFLRFLAPATLIAMFTSPAGHGWSPRLRSYYVRVAGYSAGLRRDLRFPPFATLCLAIASTTFRLLLSSLVLMACSN